SSQDRDSGVKCGSWPQDEDLARAVGEHPDEILRAEPGVTRCGRRHHDAVEGLGIPEALQGVYWRTSALDARVDRHTIAPCRELDGLENRHGAVELVLLHWRVQAELERNDEQVRGYQHGLLGMRDPQRCVEDHGIQLAIGEGHEQPRL